jgi:hypothetical protein
MTSLEEFQQNIVSIQDDNMKKIFYELLSNSVIIDKSTLRDATEQILLNQSVRTVLFLKETLIGILGEERFAMILQKICIADIECEMKESYFLNSSVEKILEFYESGVVDKIATSKLTFGTFMVTMDEMEKFRASKTFYMDDKQTDFPVLTTKVEFHGQHVEIKISESDIKKMPFFNVKESKRIKLYFIIFEKDKKWTPTRPVKKESLNVLTVVDIDNLYVSATEPIKIYNNFFEDCLDIELMPESRQIKVVFKHFKNIPYIYERFTNLEKRMSNDFKIITVEGSVVNDEEEEENLLRYVQSHIKMGTNVTALKSKDSGKMRLYEKKGQKFVCNHKMSESNLLMFKQNCVASMKDSCPCCKNTIL